jgi:hypothetical protein
VVADLGCQMARQFRLSWKSNKARRWQNAGFLYAQTSLLSGSKVIKDKAKLLMAYLLIVCSGKWEIPIKNSVLVKPGSFHFG